MTLANRITIARLLSLPVLCFLIWNYTREQPQYRYWAFGLFVAAALSDGLDGIIARRLHQKTRFGTVLDPLADKLLTNVIFVFLAANERFETHVPYWMPPILIVRDAVIVLGAYTLNRYYGSIEVHARLFGKITTAIQMLTIAAVLLEAPFAQELLWATLVVAGISLADYLYDGVTRARKGAAA